MVNYKSQTNIVDSPPVVRVDLPVADHGVVVGPDLGHQRQGEAELERGEHGGAASR